MKYAVMVGPMGTERTVRKDQVKRIEAEGYRVDRYVDQSVTRRAAQEKVDKGKWVEMETPDRTIINAPVDQVADYEAKGYKVVGDSVVQTVTVDPKPKTLSQMNVAELEQYAKDNHSGLVIPDKIVKSWWRVALTERVNNAI